MREWQGMEVIEGEVVATLPAVYVAGEQVPERGRTRQAATTGRELAPVGQEWSEEEILARFVAWMRLDVAEGHASPETIRSYFSDVRQHIGWLAGEGLRPGQAGEEELKAYRAWLVERYATSTAARKLAGVRRFYEMAQARGAIAANPAAGLKSPKDKTERHERVKYLTQVQLVQVLNAPKLTTIKGMRDRAILVLMTMHGLRTVEVNRLDLGDIDPEAGEAGTLRVLGKGDKYRTILLTEETRHELGRWLGVRQMMKAVGSEAVFVTLNWSCRPGCREPGERMSRRAIRAAVDHYLVATGVKRPGISCHSLRHSYATHALANGASLLAISGSLGHSSITTTQVYAKIVDKAKNNPAKYLVGLLG